jgi:hypothetical protein
MAIIDIWRGLRLRSAEGWPEEEESLPWVMQSYRQKSKIPGGGLVARTKDKGRRQCGLESWNGAFGADCARWVHRRRRWG